MCRLILALFFTCTYVDLALAQHRDPHHQREVRLSSSSGVLSFGKDYNLFNIQGEYMHLIQPHLQVVGQASLDVVDPKQGKSTNSLQIKVGAAYNFPVERAMIDRMYAGAVVGFRRTDNGIRDKTNGLIGAFFGKRFAINEKLSYSPKVEWDLVDNHGELSFYFLSLSYFL